MKNYSYLLHIYINLQYVINFERDKDLDNRFLMDKKHD